VATDSGAVEFLIRGCVVSPMPSKLRDRCAGLLVSSTIACFSASVKLRRRLRRGGVGSGVGAVVKLFSTCGSLAPGHQCLRWGGHSDEHAPASRPAAALHRGEHARSASCRPRCGARWRNPWPSIHSSSAPRRALPRTLGPPCCARRRTPTRAFACAACVRPHAPIPPHSAP
jgi:hypothetical protein